MEKKIQWFYLVQWKNGMFQTKWQELWETKDIAHIIKKVEEQGYTKQNEHRTNEVIREEAKGLPEFYLIYFTKPKEYKGDCTECSISLIALQEVPK